MDLNLGSAISSAVFIILCALPILMINRNRKKRKKKSLQSLSKIATQSMCQIDRYEILGNFSIGIDETKNFVFFYKRTRDKETEQSIDLSEVQSCKVINTSRTVRYKGGDQKIIDKLELSFLPIANDKPQIKLEFYNTDMSVQLYGELQSIEKWSKLINDRLIHKK